MEIKAGRNSILDMLRGHYLLAILVDHLGYYTGNSLFMFYNGNGHLWTSAAEGFVFLSGFFVGYVYYPKILAGKVWKTCLTLWKKSLNLYFWSVALTVVYTLIGYYAGNAPFVGTGIRYSGFLNLLTNTLSLKYSYGWADILILYIPLLVLSPLILVLFKKRLSWLVLLFSFCLWLLNINRTDCTRICVSFFDLTSWQLIFVLGMFVSMHRSIFRRIYVRITKTKALLCVLFAFFLITACLGVLDSFEHAFSGRSKIVIDLLFNTETLGPGRIAVFGIWFITFYFVIETFYPFISEYFGWLLLKFGRNSQLTYVLQSFILFGFFYVPLAYSFWPNTVYIALAILAVRALLIVVLKLKEMK